MNMYYSKTGKKMARNVGMSNCLVMTENLDFMSGFMDMNVFVEQLEGGKNEKESMVFLRISPDFSKRKHFLLPNPIYPSTSINSLSYLL